MGTDPKLNKRFPSVSAMAEAVPRRIPRFSCDYFSSGIGDEQGLRRNRSALDQVSFLPRYLVDFDRADLSSSLLDQNFAAPFGIAPVGLNGLIWPGASQILSAAARTHNLPFTLSTHATASIEDIAPIAGPSCWFQLYFPNDEVVAEDLLNRVAKTGVSVLVVTVDIPVATRRERDIRNGLSVPPQMSLANFLQVAARPAWAWATLRHGIPQFRGLLPYMPKNATLEELGYFLHHFTAGHITPKRLQWLRERWQGKLLVKGVLGLEDVLLAQEVGADGVVLSNHGGRQLDAAPSPAEVLPEIRNRVGPDFPILADSGVRSGLDIARYLALGADFVLLGRAPMMAVAAMGRAGGDHVLAMLKEELAMTLGQLGCASVRDLPKFLAKETH